MKYDLSEISGVIRNRRTIYPEQYTDRVVHLEMVREMITNATWAPTHGKTQPWRFKVFSGEGREVLIKNVDTLYRQFNTGDAFNANKLERGLNRIRKSSVVVLLVMQRTEETKIPEMEEVEAVAAASQNFLLTAAAYGLGAFWSSPKYLYTPEANSAFGLKPEDIIQGLIYLGYPEGEWPRSHRKPLEYVTEWIDGTEKN